MMALKMKRFEKLVNRLFEETSKSFKKLCVDLKLKVDHEKFSESCKNLIIELMPSNLLEGFEQNYQIAVAQLKEKGSNPIFFPTAYQSQTTVFISWLPQKVQEGNWLGLSMGGHYGYMYQHATAEEWEYQFADKWVSWGWSHTIASRKIPAEKFVPMPSPWVSHRKEQWKNIPIEKAKHEFDITFLPNKIYPFCPSISGARSTGNFLPVISKSHYELLSCLMANNLRVFHKGYNQSTNYLMSETIERLKIEFPLQFNLSDHYDKGLNPELVSSSKIILWDQPGTGFLECLASGIPTLVFGPKSSIEKLSKQNRFLKIWNKWVLFIKIQWIWFK